MRLFTGIEISPDVIAKLEELLRKLKPAARIQWSPAANFHVTAKFIGEWPAERLPEIPAALAKIERPGPIQIRIGRLGFFPNARSPRIFWAGVEASAGLKTLALDTDKALGELGIPREERDYSPHLTLARIRAPLPLDRLHEAIASLATLDFGAFVAAEYHLYLSKPGPGGSIYSKLATFPLS